MKYILPVFGLILAFQAFAQEEETGTTVTRARSRIENDSSFQLTPVFGLSAMSLKGDTEGWSSDTGFSTGGLVEFGSGTVTFQTGLLFNQYAYKANATRTSFFGSDSVDIRLKLNYLALPLFAKVNFMGNALSTVYLKAGVMPSSLVSKNAEAKGDYTYVNTSDIGAKSSDVPAVVGIGGAINVGHNKSIIVEGTWQRSLGKINDSEGTVRNEGVVIAGGFAFGF